MSSVILTGATGFIGKHLVPALRLSGHEVFEADQLNGDITEESTWLSFPKANIVIHLAGKSFVPESWSNPLAFIKCNLFGIIEALNYCKRNNARLIFLSSYLYGNPKTLPINENATLVAPNPYALSKKLAEETCEFYSQNFGINITILRPFNVYGPGQSTIFLIPSIINQMLGGHKIEVKDLYPRRDYIFISDLVEAIIKATEYCCGFHIFNIGTGISHSVKEVIKILQKINNSDLEIVSANEQRINEIPDTVADISLAKKTINWKPKINFEEGLLRTYNYFYSKE